MFRFQQVIDAVAAADEQAAWVDVPGDDVRGGTEAE
jgi:hypothetical protein